MLSLNNIRVHLYVRRNQSTPRSQNTHPAARSLARSLAVVASLNYCNYDSLLLPFIPTVSAGMFGGGGGGRLAAAYTISYRQPHASPVSTYTHTVTIRGDVVIIANWTGPTLELVRARVRALVRVCVNVWSTSDKNACARDGRKTVEPKRQAGEHL